MTPEDIPTNWKEVLEKVQQVFPSAVIAGGALRDTFLNKPIKDVDIFIPVPSGMTLDDAYESIWNMFDRYSWTIQLDPFSKYGTTKTETDADRDLYAIYKLERLIVPEDTRAFWCPSGEKYDLILCTEEAANIDTFDINLCQITFDGVMLSYSAAFQDAVDRKVLKVMNVNRTDRNKARMERLKQKFPDYTEED